MADQFQDLQLDQPEGQVFGLRVETVLFRRVPRRSGILKVLTMPVWADLTHIQMLEVQFSRRRLLSQDP